LDHQPVTLSGGEQQRVAIAVALANQPRILLADEPTGEVDSATAQEIYAALRKMVAADGITALVVSHDPNLGHFADRVVAIRDGKTSTETIRYSAAGSSSVAKTGSGAEPSGDGRSSQSEQIGFDELVVLDSAGRLQIPRELLENLDIGDRVRLESRDGSILIQPVAGRGRTSAPHRVFPHVGEVYIEQDRPPEIAQSVSNAGFPGLGGRIQRLRAAKEARRASRKQKDGDKQGGIDD
jgi:putative ABC transport system ATP-binding protein